MIKNVLIYIIVIAILGAGIWLFMRKGSESPSLYDKDSASITATPSSSLSAGQVQRLSDGLQIQDIVIGQGQAAKAGDTIAVHYVGTLANGTKFDSSYDHGQPFAFQLGGSQVIKGWDEGVQGMKIGGKRKLVIPPALGYGNRNIGNGLIPSNSTLIFEVELLAIQ